MTTPTRPPICATCNDTHTMARGERDVPCTFCPTPCQRCRWGGMGAYCEKTPCACACHARHRNRDWEAAMQAAGESPAQDGAPAAMQAAGESPAQDGAPAAMQAAGESPAQDGAPAAPTRPPIEEIRAKVDAATMKRAGPHGLLASTVVAVTVPGMQTITLAEYALLQHAKAHMGALAAWTAHVEGLLARAYAHVAQNAARDKEPDEVELADEIRATLAAIPARGEAGAGKPAPKPPAGTHCEADGCTRLATHARTVSGRRVGHDRVSVDLDVCDLHCAEALDEFARGREALMAAPRTP